MAIPKGLDLSRLCLRLHYPLPDFSALGSAASTRRMTHREFDGRMIFTIQCQRFARNATRANASKQ
jgi:hypothetical protein